ncbi:uncharacterized histidine-rich protein DDB_G0274557-like [Scylla paramamosain]|uniref:uncharacterized histidine-rich protein DDB_G0274557-like n=1 Tax=Scylla paramamosain TaxID=85552 RepID=UPI003082AA6D
MKFITAIALLCLLVGAALAMPYPYAEPDALALPFRRGHYGDHHTHSHVHHADHTHYYTHYPGGHTTSYTQYHRPHHYHH